jgi:asparagine synthetase B (glutamine-hydrolysing)
VKILKVMYGIKKNKKIISNIIFINVQASIGLTKIYENYSHKVKIVLSGSGVDEIMSDYSINGSDLSLASGFKGIFPKKLYDIFQKNQLI